MANNSDVFPSQDAKFDDFQIDFADTVTTNAVAWGINAGEITSLTTAQSPWTDTWAVARNKDNRTRSQINAKVTARHSYEAFLRPFIQVRIQGNPLMTDADRLACGVKPRDKVRTRVPVPSGVPELTALPGTGNSMVLYFNPPKAGDGSTQRGKPKGVSGMLLAAQFGGTEPKGPDECTYRIILTRSPKRISFDPSQAGQTIYFFGCWINAKGEQGTWTTVSKFIVP